MLTEIVRVFAQRYIDDHLIANPEYVVAEVGNNHKFVFIESFEAPSKRAVNF